MAPLRPLIVQLDSGTVLRHYYIGLDSTVYNQTRRTAARVGLLEYGRTLDAQQVASLRAELLRCRGQVDAANDDFSALATVNRQLAAQPLARPLLLDSHTYLGAGAGAVVLLALKLFLHF